MKLLAELAFALCRAMAVLLIVLTTTGCTTSIIRDCDDFFYGAYQGVPGTKALAQGFPKDQFTTKEYTSRCVTGRMMDGSASSGNDLQLVIEHALWTCERQIRQYNSPGKAAEMQCLIYAKNNQIMPWVAQMRAAWNDKDSDQTMAILAAAMTGAAAATSPDPSAYISSVDTIARSMDKDQANDPTFKELTTATNNYAASAAGKPEYIIHPEDERKDKSKTAREKKTSKDSNSTNSAETPATAKENDESWEPYEGYDPRWRNPSFEYNFKWCIRADTISCDKIEFLNHKDIHYSHSMTVNIDTIGVIDRFDAGSFNELEYVVTLRNGSPCSAVIMGTYIEHGTKLETWDIGMFTIEPGAEITSKKKAFRFNDTASNNFDYATIKINGQYEDCNK